MCNEQCSNNVKIKELLEDNIKFWNKVKPETNVESWHKTYMIKTLESILNLGEKK